MLMLQRQHREECIIILSQLLLPKPHNFIKFSFATSTSSSSNWRTQLHQNHLASQISSTLLQRRNWVSLLPTLNLSSNLTPSLFLQILRRIQSHPQISLAFFNWAKSNQGFHPDLKSHSHIIQLAIASRLYRPAKPLLDSLIREHPASSLAKSLIRACEGKTKTRDLLSIVLSFVVERYSQKGLFLEGLEVFRLMRFHGCIPTVRSCNALLDALLRENEIQLAWCLYGTLVRFGYRLGRSTLSIVAQILSKNGKFDKIVRLLDSGVYELGIYNLVIGGYSEKGDFKSAFHALNEMSDRKLAPDFDTYSSILDGACKHEDTEVTERIINIMVEKKLLPKCFNVSSSSSYDLVVQKLSDMGKTYAAEMFYRRACEENISLEDVTYGCLLRALSKGRRIREAVSVYSIVSQKGLALDDSNYYQTFVNFLCEEEDLYVEAKSCELLKDIIRRGLEFDPYASEFSKFMTSLCNEGRWKEAEDLLDALVERGLVPDSGFCSLMMKRYCKCRQIDSAIELHEKMEKFNGKMDITAYNVFLRRLFVVMKIEEAVKVFDYMRRQDLLSSESFVIMIGELCKVKELRKAMKLHDEMLKMGLKPDKPTYRRLIVGFV